jgi:hypothetical protein
MTIPQVETGKRHDEPMNFSLIIPLPASTPYGNLQLKHITIMRNCILRMGQVHCSANETGCGAYERF